jgi:Ca-activated chloride channel family protein
MTVATRSPSPRRSLAHPLLDQYAALLLVLASGCTQTLNSHESPKDFNDDKKDAGEIGAGHAVTALYEVVPKGALSAPPKTDPLKYQTAPAVAAAAASDELLTVNIRYKQPSAESSAKLRRVVQDGSVPLAQTSADFRFGAAVAEAALVLRGAPDLGTASLEGARALAQGALGQDPTGDRHEFISLLAKARALGPSPVAVLAK